MLDEKGFEIVGWCHYCHSEIRIGEDCDMREGNIYHKECWQIINNYYDPYDFGEEDEE